MFDIAAIAGAVSALKGAKDIAEAMVGLRDAEAFQAKRLELQSRLLDAQGSIFAVQEERTTLVKRIGDLEAQITEFEAWEREKPNYELREIASGVFAYASKTEASGSGPAHYLCANCYQDRKKSLLQKETLTVLRSEILGCSRCGAVVYLRGSSVKEHAPALARFRRGV